MVGVAHAQTTPQAPHLTAAAGNSQVTLSCNQTAYPQNANQTVSYNIYRGTSAGGEGAAVYATMSTPSDIETPVSYTDTAVTNGTTYYYQVVAAITTRSGGGFPTPLYISVQQNPSSNEVSATPTAPVALAAPTDLAVYATGSGKVTLYWSGIAGASGYNIYRGTAAGGEDYAHPVNGAAPVTTQDNGPGVTNMFLYSDTGLTNGTEYFYTIKAVNGSSQSGPSNEDSGIIDATGIPYDTRDPAQIIPAVSQMVSNNLTQNESGVGVLSVAGPDGVIYQGNYPNGDPPLALAAAGKYDGSSNTITYTDGTTTPAPPLDDDSSALGGTSNSVSQTASTMSCPPLTPKYNHSYPAKNPNATGIFRKVESQPGQYGLESFITLPNPNDSNPYDHSSVGLYNGDTAFIYTGGAVWNYASNSETSALDVGLQLSTQSQNGVGWRPFILDKRKAGTVFPGTIYLGSPTYAQVNGTNHTKHVFTVVLSDSIPLMTFQAPGYGTIKNKHISLTITGHVLASYYDQANTYHNQESVGSVTYVYVGIKGWTKKACLMIKRANSIGQKIPSNAGSGPGGGFNLTSSFVYGADWGLGYSNVTLFPGGEMDQNLVAIEGSYPAGPSAGGYINWLEQSAFSWEQNINLRTSLNTPHPLY